MIRRLRSHRGFTLVEMVITIVVVSLIAAVATVGYRSIVDRARQANVDQSAKAFDTLYRANLAFGDLDQVSAVNRMISSGDINPAEMGISPLAGGLVPLGTTQLSFTKDGYSACLALAANASEPQHLTKGLCADAVPVPAAPTGVSATVLETTATVVYMALSDVTVDSYMATCSSGTGTTRTGTASSGSIAVAALTSGATYTCVVSAHNPGGWSPTSTASNTIDPVTTPPDPDTPTGLIVTPGAAQVELAWTANSSGATVAGYRIYMNSAFRAQVVGPDVTGYTVTGLTNGTSYSFQITAYFDTRESAPSSALTATPRDVPDAPTGISVAVSMTTATVSYTPPASNEGAVISGYRATCSSSDGGTTRTGVGSGDISVTSLTADATYTCSVAAQNVVGFGSESAASASVFPYNTASAPAGPSSASSGTTITVTWTPVSPAAGEAVTGYNIYQTGASTATYIASGGSTSSYDVTGLVGGSTYSFQVQARYATHAGPLSDTVTVLLVTAPGAPTIGAATVDLAAVTVSYTAPISDGGAAISGYRGTCVSSDGGTTAAASVVSGDVVVTGLTVGKTYTCTVAATNTAGYGTESADTNAVVTYTTPAAPAAPTATPGNSQVVLSWTPMTSTSGQPIEGYRIYIGSTLGCQVVGADATGCTVTGLVNGTSYDFQQVAYYAGHEGSQSAVTTSIPRTTPGSPTGVTATSGANAQSVVTWTAPASNGGSAITSYIATSNPGGFTCTSASSPCTVTGLSNGTAYTFTVSAINAAGSGAASAASAAATPRTIPSAPTGVNATSNENAKSTVSWTAPVSNGGSVITSYSVTSNPSGPTCTSSGAPAATTCVVTGLTNGTSYQFRVIAANAVGSSANSSYGPVNFPYAVPATVPGKPTVIGGSAGDGYIYVRWSAPASNGGTAVLSYTVTATLLNDANVVGTCSLDASITPLGCTISGLINNSTYTATVTATNAVGTGLKSAVSGNYFPQGPPYAPSVTASVAAAGQITCGWFVANNGGRPVTSYNVWTSMNGGAWVARTSQVPPAISLVVTGLPAGQSFQCQVQAVNTLGSSGMGQSTSVVTY